MIIVEKLHGTIFKDGMAIAEAETVELQICDACTKNCTKNKPYTLLIQNFLDSTIIDDQHESLLYPSQVRDHMTIVEDSACDYGGNQRMHTSETNIPAKCNGKDMRDRTAKATKLESETLLVVKLTGRTKIAPPQPNNEIKRIRNLKTKP